eukprot:IDg3391t1
MDPPIVNEQNENVPLGEKLAILRYTDEDNSVLEPAQEFGVLQENVSGATLIDKDHSLLQAFNKYGIAKSSVKRILGDRETLIALDKSGVPGYTR